MLVVAREYATLTEILVLAATNLGSGNMTFMEQRNWPGPGRAGFQASLDSDLRLCKYDSGDQNAVHTLVPSPNRRGARAIICCKEEKIDLPGFVKSCPDKGKVLVQAMGACKPIEPRISLDSSLDTWSEAATYL